MSTGLHIYVDADACPVKAEVVKVAGRHGLPVVFVANARAFITMPEFKDAAGFDRLTGDDEIRRIEGWILGQSTAI